MLLTITTTHTPATDLGYLLHKNPARTQSFSLSYGKAHVFYPRAEEECCTAALLLEIDPISLVRGRRGPVGERRIIAHYVNDRPYVASSFLSVAIAQVFGTALGGRCKERPELAETALPLQVSLSAVPCRGGEKFLRQLFEPLGYRVRTEQHSLDELFPEWGESPYFSIQLKATCRLSELLSHLYVLIPVLDAEKHYWVGEDELDKLLRHGAGWLADHPSREAIVTRYLKHRRSLARAALVRLEEDSADEAGEGENEEEKAEKPLRLNEIRLQAVVEELKKCGARRVLDLGCGSGKLLQKLQAESMFTKIVGMDVSLSALEIARKRLSLDRRQGAGQASVELLHGSLVYRDWRLSGFDAAAVIEVIEHLDPHHLSAFEQVLFAHTKPSFIVVTTPNREYNVNFINLPEGKLRHRDHRFEWTRKQLQAWAKQVAERYGYSPRFSSVGPEDPVVGAPTQMVVFEKLT